MKKIFMLLFSATLVTSAFAQKGYDKHYDDKHNQQQSNKAYNAGRERDALIARINAQYDSRIESVEHNRYLKNRERKQDIKQLEKQRKQELKESLARFDRNRNSPYKEGMVKNDRRY